MPTGSVEVPQKLTLPPATTVQEAAQVATAAASLPAVDRRPTPKRTNTATGNASKLADRRRHVASAGQAAEVADELPARQSTQPIEYSLADRGN